MVQCKSVLGGMDTQNNNEEWLCPSDYWSVTSFDWWLHVTVKLLSDTIAIGWYDVVHIYYGFSVEAWIQIAIHNRLLLKLTLQTWKCSCYCKHGPLHLLILLLYLKSEWLLGNEWNGQYMKRVEHFFLSKVKDRAYVQCYC